MNISKSFADFLETLLGATLGQDLFIGNAPSSNKVQDSIWWMVATGGSRITDAVTGESVKEYSIEVYRRARDYKTVYNDLQSLEVTLNCTECVELEGFDTIDIRASVLSIDNDLDDEDRKVGLLQSTIDVYEDCIDVS